MPKLFPLRHGRMVRSAFTFYRGAALTTAADLASTPSFGVDVFACDDKGLSAAVARDMGVTCARTCHESMAIAAVSLAYAEQNEEDHATLDRAARSGRVKAVFEEASQEPVQVVAERGIRAVKQAGISRRRGIRRDQTS